MPDNHDFNLWPLAQMTDYVMVDQPVAPPRVEIVFGDFLINSHRYALKTDTAGFFFVTSDASIEEKLADSFAHFIKLYLSEPDKLYL